jgi:hypothetical protein
MNDPVVLTSMDEPSNLQISPIDASDEVSVINGRFSSAAYHIQNMIAVRSFDKSNRRRRRSRICRRILIAMMFPIIGF